MRKRVRDMTERQLIAAIRKAGWEPNGFMGYVELGGGVSVSRYNAGANRRAQLAYLQREADRLAARRAAE